MKEIKLSASDILRINGIEPGLEDGRSAEEIVKHNAAMSLVSSGILLEGVLLKRRGADASGTYSDEDIDSMAREGLAVIPEAYTQAVYEIEI